MFSVLEGKDMVVNTIGLGEKVRKEEFRVYVWVMKRLASVWSGGRVYTATRGAHWVGGGGRGGGRGQVRPWARAVWSFGRAFGAECSERLVHVLVDVSGKQKEVWGREVAREAVWEGAPGGAEVAFSVAGERHVASLRNRRQGGARKQGLSEVLQGLVVLTGGFGGIGRVYVRSVLATDERTGVLVLGRRGLSAGSSDEQNLVGGVAASVVCGLSDVGKGEEAANVVRAGRQGSGMRVTSVLHLAGQLQDGMLVNLGWSDMARVMRPKVGGMQAMWRTVGEKGVAWIVFSSVTSLLGNVGQTNYAAANGFLDGMAARQSELAVSVNWGAWDVGMYLRSQRGASLPQEEFVIAEGEAKSLLEAAWASGSAEIGVMRMDWKKNGSFLSRKMATASAAKAGGRRGGGAARMSETEVLQVVDSCVKSVLGMSEIDALDETAALRDLGFDSVMSVELRDRISEQLGTQLPATLLFDYPTMKALRAKMLELVGVTDVGAVVEVRNKKGQMAGEVRVVLCGVACRFGEAWSVKGLWRVFSEGLDEVKVVPKSRWRWEDVYDADASSAGKSVSKSGRLLDGLEQFDASFFGISPREAMAMDPRGRMLLETGWECAEDAGLVPLSLERDASHTVGVYVGTWPSEYGERVQDEQLLQYVGVGTAPSAAAGRVSYFFGLTGNCVSIDTACSSSLVSLI